MSRRRTSIETAEQVASANAHSRHAACDRALYFARTSCSCTRRAGCARVSPLTFAEEMDFDSLVARLELSLLPVLRKEEAALRVPGRFSDVRVASLRHADSLHAMGIACRPIWASEELERLGFGTTLMGFDGLSGRIDVQWSQVFAPSTGSGYLKKEAGGYYSKLMSEAAIMRFEKEWLRLFGLFLRVAARGKPSMYLLRRLRGAPPDQRGWKEEANQSPEPTRFARGPS